MQCSIYIYRRRAPFYFIGIYNTTRQLYSCLIFSLFIERRQRQQQQQRNFYSFKEKVKIFFALFFLPSFFFENMVAAFATGHKEHEKKKKKVIIKETLKNARCILTRRRNWKNERMCLLKKREKRKRKKRIKEDRKKRWRTDQEGRQKYIYIYKKRTAGVSSCCVKATDTHPSVQIRQNRIIGRYA